MSAICFTGVLKYNISLVGEVFCLNGGNGNEGMNCPSPRGEIRRWEFSDDNVIENGQLITNLPKDTVSHDRYFVFLLLVQPMYQVIPYSKYVQCVLSVSCFACNIPHPLISSAEPSRDVLLRTSCCSQVIPTSFPCGSRNLTSHL